MCYLRQSPEVMNCQRVSFYSQKHRSKPLNLIFIAYGSSSAPAGLLVFTQAFYTSLNGNTYGTKNDFQGIDLAGIINLAK